MASTRVSTYDLVVDQPLDFNHLLSSEDHIISIDVDPATKNVLLLVTKNYKQEFVLCDPALQLLSRKPIRLSETNHSSLHTARFLHNRFIVGYSQNHGESDWLFLFDPLLSLVLERALGYTERHLFILNGETSFILLEGPYHKCSLIKVETNSEYDQEFEGFVLVEDVEKQSLSDYVERYHIEQGLPVHFRTLSEFHIRDFLTENKEIKEEAKKTKPASSLSTVSEQKQTRDGILYLYGMATISDNKFVVCGNNNGILFLSFCEIKENQLVVNSVLNLGPRTHERSYFDLSCLPTGDLVICLHSLGSAKEPASTFNLYFLKKVGTGWIVTSKTIPTSTETVINSRNIAFLGLPPPFFSIRGIEQDNIVNLEDEKVYPILTKGKFIDARDSQSYVVQEHKAFQISVINKELDKTLQALPDLRLVPIPVIELIASYANKSSFFSQRETPSSSARCSFPSSSSSSSTPRPS